MSDNERNEFKAIVARELFHHSKKFETRYFNTRNRGVGESDLPIDPSKDMEMGSGIVLNKHFITEGEFNNLGTAGDSGKTQYFPEGLFQNTKNLERVVLRAATVYAAEKKALDSSIPEGLVKNWGSKPSVLGQSIFAPTEEIKPAPFSVEENKSHSKPKPK